MIKNLLGDDDDRSVQVPDPVAPASAARSQGLGLFDSDQADENAEKEEFVLSRAEPETFAETTRRSGLAWSAGVVFVASVGFMLVIGWGADLLLGSAPWGLVGGIVLGSLIGFVQFFRLTSQIFPK
jgi:F0F1-type ATP synthase assembly protein I